MCGSLTANVFDEDLFFGDYHYLKELTWLIRHVRKESLFSSKKGAPKMGPEVTASLASL